MGFEPRAGGRMCGSRILQMGTDKMPATFVTSIPIDNKKMD